MIGTYDFCGHYDWTFEWLRKKGGEQVVREYWQDAICNDSQIHASELIRDKGFDGMEKFWGHTLAEEAAGYTTARGPGVYRFDMADCPSKGFLIRNGLAAYSDYCDHCIGWIGPMMAEAGFVIDHEHNHCGQCWWEFRRKEDPTPASTPGELAGRNDIRRDPGWDNSDEPTDLYTKATDSSNKTSTHLRPHMP